jgi:hypothetical protein
MKKRDYSNVAMVAVAVALVIGFGGLVAADEETPAKAGEKVGVEGTFVRVAENSEGWVVVGYRAANGAVGKEWVFFDIGLTVQKGVKGEKITRDEIKLVTPKHEVIDMATQEEYSKAAGSLAAMEREANMMHDSIDYFPPGADQVCRIGFFTDQSQPMRGPVFDEVELSPNRACLGRVYFQVPGGIQLGNYNLDVHFADSILKVPVEIMTKEQAKEFEKKWKEAEKEAKHEK